ncbi:MAG TPA: response regulator [Patescibacteria group bacterium]|nr:response regulator [Patescibacteria group bacterium]
MTSERKKILIIEDDKSLVKLFAESLDQKKFQVFMAIEADEGLDKAIQEKPDLIILDIMLPGKNGFQCLKELKDQPKTKKIPVIVLSNLGQAEEIRRGLDLGAIDYLVKADFQIDEVIEKIDKTLG